MIVNADPVRPSPLTKKKRSDDPYAGYSDVVHVSTKRMTPPVTVEEIRRRVDEWNAKNRCVYGDKKLCSDFVNFVAFGKDTSFAPVPTLCGR